MARCDTRAWTAADIDRAVAAAMITEYCPQCPDMLDPAHRAPSVIETVGPWTLSVGASDVLVTVPMACRVHCHRFLLRASLWRRARMPVRGPRVKRS